jgi:hypothetical protein
MGAESVISQDCLFSDTYRQFHFAGFSALFVFNASPIRFARSRRERPASPKERLRLAW